MRAALTRIIMNHIARTFRQKFAHHLLSYNFAVGIDNGMNFVLKASQLVVEKYITRKGKNGQTPSCHFISLDLTNMSSEISGDFVL